MNIDTPISLRGSQAPQVPDNADLVAPDCRDQNFWEVDRGIRDLVALYLPEELRQHMTPHFQHLGGIAGGRLDELASTADKHEPVLHARDRFGRDEDWIEYHPAYREMEKIAFGEFGMHAMAHRGGVLGWPEPLPPLVRYVFTYLFVQGEFGLTCPISLSDTGNYMILRYGPQELVEKWKDRLLSQDMDTIWKGSQFMTEKAGGSDVGLSALTAVRAEDGSYRLHGDKWFCSHADADVAVLLARIEGAPEGSRGLSLFVMPRRLEDGSRNAYRITRLKQKLGTKSMASGEIVFNGAVAYLLGEEGKGLKQMMTQVNLSRLSHGVRAASMMRRCLNEALTVARHRRAFGRPLIEHALMRRQLVKLMLPTEQALSAFMYAADLMTKSYQGDETATKRLRIVTPLIKLRACRDNIPVATGAMEVRGGNGYIEEWINARLIRDAQIGVLWEGTSNINALDVVTRAIAKEGADQPLKEDVDAMIAGASGLSGQERGRLQGLVDRAFDFAAKVAADPRHEKRARQASAGLYNALTAALLASEGSCIGAKPGGDASRLLLSRLVTDHRLGSADPFSLEDSSNEEEIIDLLLKGEPVPLDRARDLTT